MHTTYPGSKRPHPKNVEASWSTSTGTGSLTINEPRTIALVDHETVSHRVHRDERGRAVYIEAVRTKQRRTLLLQREYDLVLARMVAEKKRDIVNKRWHVGIAAVILVAMVVMGLNLPADQLTLRIDQLSIFLPLWIGVMAILALLYAFSTAVGPELRIPAALRFGKGGDAVTAERWIELEESLRGCWGADDLPVSEREDMFTRMRAEDRDALFELTRTDPPAFRQLFELLVRQWSSERETIAREKARLAQEHDQRRLQEADAIAEKKFTELGFTVPNTPQWQKDQRYNPHG